MATTQNFISVDFDKHKQVTTTTSVSHTPLGYTIVLESGVTGISMQTKLRHVKSPDIDSLLIDLRLDSSDSWLFLRNGKMSIVADSENISIECNESYADTSTFYDSGVREVVYYKINREILDKICSAKELDIRISGDTTYLDIANKEKSITRFQTMCQQFYNNFYDNSKYSVATSQNLKPKGGCFIATAAMGNYDHPVVLDLRMFRDNWLIKRNWGVQFTNWYYTHGPKAANVIEKSKFLKSVTFILVVKPLQLISKLFR
jgi:hypothetical protein